MIPRSLFHGFFLLTTVILIAQNVCICAWQLEGAESRSNTAVSILPALNVKAVHGEFFSFDDEPSISTSSITSSTPLYPHAISTAFAKNEMNTTSIPEGHHETIDHLVFNESVSRVALGNVSSPASAPSLGHVNDKKFLDAQTKNDKIILQTPLTVNNSAAFFNANSNATQLEKHQRMAAVNQTTTNNVTIPSVLNVQRFTTQPIPWNSSAVSAAPTAGNLRLSVHVNSNAIHLEKRPGPVATNQTINANATIPSIANALRFTPQPIPLNTVNATRPNGNMTLSVAVVSNVTQFEKRQGPAATNQAITAIKTIPPVLSGQQFLTQPLPLNPLNATRPVGNIMTFTVHRPTRKRRLRPFAVSCDPTSCHLPNCRCGSSGIPGSIPLDETPQIILLTFDDAVTPSNFEDYRIIFEKNWTNPNGCPIRGTFYVSDEWTKYNLVTRLYHDGHEMASHSIGHINPPANATRRFWEKEIYGQKENLNKFGGVPLEEIRGMRAPFLQIGGDLQFEMLAEKGFLYDSSIVTNRGNPPLWPYTLDFELAHNCVIEPCPRKSYPGLWEVPMVQWESDLWSVPCAMVDTCSITSVASRSATHDLIMKNFKRHYKTNRAPFGIFMHATWFLQKGRLKGLQDFLDAVMQYDDVWIITTTQAIQWIQNPTTLTSMETKDFTPWSCKK